MMDMQYKIELTLNNTHLSKESVEAYLAFDLKELQWYNPNTKNSACHWSVDSVRKIFPKTARQELEQF